MKINLNEIEIANCTECPFSIKRSNAPRQKVYGKSYSIWIDCKKDKDIKGSYNDIPDDCPLKGK